MSQFTTPLRLEVHAVPIKQRPFELIEKFEYYTDLFDERTLIRVPKGYRTDFASIPRFFWRLFPPYGQYGKAAVVHDWLCDVEPKMCDHKMAAAVFREAMKVLNVPKVTRMIIYKAVLWFGPEFDTENPL